jgi:aspartyl-tRNA(Asn)/glutamyl-tRNA(Gln) amidotransferase subunit B
MRKLAANWMTGDFFAALNRTGRSIETRRFRRRLGELLDLMADKHDQRPHRQGCVRGDGGDRRGPAAIVEEKGPAPGDGYRRDRRGGGRGAGGQPGQGRGI